MVIKHVKDPDFRKYGIVLSGVNADHATKVLADRIQAPENAIAYVPSVDFLEQEELFNIVRKDVFGDMPIQFGYCCGQNHTLNCLEYHRGSEFNVAAEDMIFLLADLRDVSDDNLLDTSKVEAFLVPAGVCVLIYETTLHYAPISSGADSFFHCIVGLPRGTNEPFTAAEQTVQSNPLIRARNKWLLAHPDAPEAADGAWIGLTGINLTL